MDSVNEYPAFDIANTPLAIIMLAELPEHVSLKADCGETLHGSTTPEILARTIALVESYCPASATLSSDELHAAINEQLTLHAPTMHHLWAKILERQGGLNANIWTKAAVLGASKTFTGQR